MNTIHSPTRPKRRTSSLAMMLVLVACVAVMCWAWRRTSETAIARDIASTIRRGSNAERIRAMSELWNIPAEQAHAVSSSLFATLEDPDPEVRSRAAEALFYSVHTIDDPRELSTIRANLLRAITHHDPRVRACAASLLGTLRLAVTPIPITGAPPIVLGPEVVAVLTTATTDPDGEVRGVALNSLANGLNDPRAKARLLLRGAADADARVRGIAIHHLRGLANLFGEARMVVIHTLLDPSAEIQNTAASVDFTTPMNVPTEAVPKLVQVLQVPPRLQSPAVRRTALSYLEAMGPAGRAAVPELLRQLPTRAMPIWDTEVLQTLGAVAPHSQEAKDWIPALILQVKTTVTRGSSARNLAFVALKSYLWAPEVVATFRELADDADPSMKAMAAAVVKGLGPDRESLLPEDKP